MKKLLFIITIMVSSRGFSQLPKGSIYGGISFGFSSLKTQEESKTGSLQLKEEPSKDLSYFVAPSGHYFMKDNFAIGTSIGYMLISNKYTIPDPIKYESNYYFSKIAGPAISIEVNKFWKIRDKFYSYGGCGIGQSFLNGFDYTKTTLSDGYLKEYKTLNKLSTSTLIINFGLAYQISPRLLVTGGIACLKISSTTFKYNIKGENYDKKTISGMDFLNSTTTPPTFSFIYQFKSSK